MPGCERGLMFKSILIAYFILLGPIHCRAEKVMMTERGEVSANVCTPGYWQLNYGVPQYGKTYSISIEVENVQDAEERIMKLAADSGAVSQSGGGYGWNAGYGSVKGRSKYLSFSADEAKAERFAQKIIAEGRLIQYNSNQSMQPSMYSDVKKKSDLLEEEFRQNRHTLEKMPIASCILGELQERYDNFLRGYESAKSKAGITLNLSEKTPVRETPGENNDKKGRK